MKFRLIKLLNVYRVFSVQYTLERLKKRVHRLGQRLGEKKKLILKHEA